MRYCFDIDGTICDTPMTDDPRFPGYLTAEPRRKVIKKINELYDKGHYIILQTARGAKSGIDWGDLTLSQLDDWGVKYHHLMPMFSKPDADIFIDDKGLNAYDWIEKEGLQ